MGYSMFGEVGVAIIEQRTTAVTNNVTERFVYLSVDFSVAGDSDTAALSCLSISISTSLAENLADESADKDRPS